MPKTKCDLPANRLLERVLAVAQLLVMPPEDTSEKDDDITPIVDPTAGDT